MMPLKDSTPNEAYMLHSHMIKLQQQQNGGSSGGAATVAAKPRTVKQVKTTYKNKHSQNHVVFPSLDIATATLSSKSSQHLNKFNSKSDSDMLTKLNEIERIPFHTIAYAKAQSDRYPSANYSEWTKETYKECARHIRTIKDVETEQKCEWCKIAYYLCEKCRVERKIQKTSDSCINCAPAAIISRGLLLKKDRIIHELQYKLKNVEDSYMQARKEITALRKRLNISEEERQHMDENYLKTVSETKNQQLENEELSKQLEAAIKQINQYQIEADAHNQLINDYYRLLKSEEHSDCQLQLTMSGDHYNLHRSILSCRSKYFKNLIESMIAKETTRDNMISLENISKECINQIFEYIYCGRCSNIRNDNTAIELYEIADKLGLPLLKDFIVNYFVRKINRDNCIQISLRTVVIQQASDNYRNFLKAFFLTHCIDLIDINSKSSDWRRLKDENPQFVLELLEQKAAKKGKVTFQDTVQNSKVKVNTLKLDENVGVKKFANTFVPVINTSTPKTTPSTSTKPIIQPIQPIIINKMVPQVTQNQNKFNTAKSHNQQSFLDKGFIGEAESIRNLSPISLLNHKHSAYESDSDFDKSEVDLENDETLKEVSSQKANKKQHQQLSRSSQDFNKHMSANDIAVLDSFLD